MMAHVTMLLMMLVRMMLQLVQLMVAHMPRLMMRG